MREAKRSNNARAFAEADADTAAMGHDVIKARGICICCSACCSACCSRRWRACRCTSTTSAGLRDYGVVSAPAGEALQRLRGGDQQDRHQAAQQAGILTGGRDVVHDCGAARPIGHFLEPLLLLGLNFEPQVFRFRVFQSLIKIVLEETKRSCLPDTAGWLDAAPCILGYQLLPSDTGML